MESGIVYILAWTQEEPSELQKKRTFIVKAVLFCDSSNIPGINIPFSSIMVVEEIVADANESFLSVVADGPN